VKTIRVILFFAGSLTSGATIFFAIITYRYLKMPFNSEGNYFDEETSVNYDTDGLGAFSAITIVALLASASLFFLASQLKKKQLHKRHARS
jgi:hypothetical protein